MSRDTYLTPGPSQPHPKLRRFLDDAWEADVLSLSHRGPTFEAIYQRADTALRTLLGIPPAYQVLFMGSATEAMERIIQSVVVSRSHHFIGGAFSEKWFEVAQQLGKQPTAARVKPGQPFTKADLQVPADTELLCITQNETSTGTAFPDAELLHLTKASSSKRPLVALDVVSSVPLRTLPWDRLDLVFFSVQKAFGLPAGLGVLIAGPRALAKAAKLEASGQSVGSYHSLPRLAASAAKFQTPETPNVLGIYLLGRVAEDLLARGIDVLRQENQTRARALYAVLNDHPYLEPFVTDPHWRSTTVIVTAVRHGNHALHQTLKEQGLIVGQGYQPFQEEHLRIANFPATDDRVFERLLVHLQGYRSKPGK